MNNRPARSRTRAASRRTHKHKSPTEQPGNSFKYLYWRLTEKQFQQLCSALLRHKYDPVQCFPVGMADEGIDAISHGSVIYQVKWTSKFEQDPATWLKDTIEGERSKIARLVAAGRASRYILVTSVAGTTTGKKGTGNQQKLDKDLKAYSREFGIPVECWWQADVDAEVDAAPDAIKWSYQEMLAGTDAMRYLMHASQVAGDAAVMRDTVLHVMASQWRDDSKIKFSQVEMDRVNLVDLFVDVHARLQAAPSNAVDQFFSARDLQAHEGAGAVEYLLKSTVPLTYLLGVPGQGKSTLGQYLCQVHRAAILPGDMLGDRKPPHESVTDPKLPLRVDLKDYAAWLSGHDPFGDDEPVKKPRRRRKDQRSLDLFLAAFCTAQSGGRRVTVEQVQSLLARYPTLLVLDGLDEVADPELRKIVVDEIELTAMRMGSGEPIRRFQVLVTARPNASGLPEPDRKRFQTLRLEPLTPDLQREFVRKWADVNEVRGPERRKLQRIVQSRTAIDHIAQLADNPMQLTILLFLIDKKGEAVPVSRTPLYSDYMGTLLDREVDRGQIEREQVSRVAEATSFLGWHMQSGVETDAAAGRMGRDDIETTLIVYFRRTEGPSEHVSNLFKAVSDRFWALSSQIDGTFEFAVQPVREYFAARFLAEWAGQDMRSPLPKQEVLRCLIERPYWLNTARFYAGFANPNELASLRYGLEEALVEHRHPLQERVAVWALLNDGIFADKATVQRDVVRLLTDDLSLRLISSHSERSADFPRLSRASGGEQMIAALQDDLQTDPASPNVMARTLILRDHLPLGQKDFAAWWTPRMRAAIGTPHETAWLRIGGLFGVPRVLPPEAHRISLTDPESCQAALSAGVSPEGGGSNQDKTLLRAVLDGWCSDTATSSSSSAGALLRAMRPQWYLQLPEEARDGSTVPTEHFWLGPLDRSSRSSALNQLTNLDSEYERLKIAANPRAKGKKGTTEPWQESARQLARIHGPCWLAAEIAIIGAATRGTLGEGSHDPGGGGEPLGDNADYGRLVLDLHRGQPLNLWTETYERFADSLSRCTWVLALLATADDEVVIGQLDRVDAVLTEATENQFFAAAASSSRIGATRIPRRLGAKTLAAASGRSPRATLLVTHFASRLDSLDPLAPLSEHQLEQLACTSAAAWPIARAVTSRLLEQGTDTLLSALMALGPQSTVLVPEETGPLGTDVVASILKSPAQYPASWVEAAERSYAAISTEATMEKVAVDQGWMPRVPRV